MSSVIGSLRVNLGIDTAAFSNGIKNATKDLKNVGQQMQSIGRTLTTRVSAPIAAAAGGIAAGAFRMSQGLVELRNQAQVANTTVEEFQRYAAAARTVGIENEKFSDILKDVNDRIGDFIATGGGPMADFFENIAPKVGITADAFKDLSGPQAMQLFFNSLEKADLSQADLTFYLEAMASDMTALIPLLQNGGAEFERLGDRAASFGLATEEQVESALKFQEAFEGLKQALTGVGLALVDAGVVEVITSITEWLSKMATSLREVDPQLVKFGTIAAGIAAALGPVVLGLGFFVAGIAAIGAPIAAGIAGVAALTSAVVYFWPEIKAAGQAVIDFGANALDWIVEKIRTLPEMLAALPGQMLEIGRDLIQGLWDGVSERLAPLREWMSGVASSITGVFERVWDTHSPSRVFHEIGTNLMQGLHNGIGSLTGQVSSNVESFAQNIGQKFEGILKGTTDFRSAFYDIMGSIGNSFINRGLNLGFSAIGIPGYANGTNFHPGGLAIVGERGPELLNLPRGSRVTPNHELGAQKLEVHIHENAADGQHQVQHSPGRVDVMLRKMLQSEIQKGGLDTALTQRFGVRPKAMGG